MREYTAPTLSMFSKPWLYSSGGERSRAHLRETSEGEARGSEEEGCQGRSAQCSLSQGEGACRGRGGVRKRLPARTF